MYVCDGGILVSICDVPGKEDFDDTIIHLLQQLA